jgi:hypothetical protein
MVALAQERHERLRDEQRSDVLVRRVVWSISGLR